MHPQVSPTLVGIDLAKDGFAAAAPSGHRNGAQLCPLMGVPTKSERAASSPKPPAIHLA